MLSTGAQQGRPPTAAEASRTGGPSKLSPVALLYERHPHVDDDDDASHAGRPARGGGCGQGGGGGGGGA